jgi:hypothetical protein
MVTCRETVGDCGRSLSQTSYFSEDRRCRSLPTDTTVKSKTERSDTASDSITKRRLCRFRVRDSQVPSSPFSTATPSKSCTTTALNVSGSMASTVQRRAKPMASERSRLLQHSSMAKKSRFRDLRPRQVRAHPWRCVPVGWDERQSGTRQARLVLVVSQICAWRH